jgi:hypothetical protein
MKKTSSQFPKSIILALLLGGACLNLASAAPESFIYAPGEIHHYASNGGASTITVEVPHHYSFRDGQYVWVPSYKAEAPLPQDKYAAAYWVTRTTTASGHWARQAKGDNPNAR